MRRNRIGTQEQLLSPEIDFEKDLNPEQYQVVMHPQGPMLVLAGAGTGKTRTVTYRVARLITSGTPAQSILLLTFTNKAAREMMQRVEQILDRKIRGLWGGTFHHVCNMILRRHGSLLGYRDGFTIPDREDQKDLLDSVRAEFKNLEDALPSSVVLAGILG